MRGPFRSRTRARSTTGSATSSASACSRFSSRPTPRRCGACPATRYPRTGPLNASRASTSGLPFAMRCSGRSACSLGQRRDSVKTLIERFEYPRRGPGMMWEAAARKVEAQGGRLLMGRELERLSYDSAQGLWQIAVTNTDGGREHYTARHVISSAPAAELIGKIEPPPQSLLARARAPLPRLHHRRADAQEAGRCSPTTGSISMIRR